MDSLVAVEEEEANESQDIFGGADVDSQNGSGTDVSSSVPTRKRNFSAETSGRTPKRERSSTHQLQSAVVQLLQQPDADDETDLYGRTVAQFLRRIAPQDRRPFQNAVNDIMQDYEFGTPQFVSSDVVIAQSGGGPSTSGYQPKPKDIELDDNILA